MPGCSLASTEHALKNFSLCKGLAMNKEILLVAETVSNEKGVSRDVIFEAIELALSLIHI